MGKRIKYRANFSANNGTHLIEPIEDTSYRRICQRIRSLADAERQQYARADWWVWKDGIGTDTLIRGYIDKKRSYHIIYQYK